MPAIESDHRLQAAHMAPHGEAVSRHGEPDVPAGCLPYYRLPTSTGLQAVEGNDARSKEQPVSSVIS